MTTAHDRDFHAWALDQAALLRAGRRDDLDREHRLAVIEAARETGLREAAFPARCPFAFEQMLDHDFWPDDGGSGSDES